MICFGVEPAYFVSEYQRFRLLVPVVPSLTAVISFLQIWKTKLKNSGKVVPPAPELGGVGMVQVAAGEGGAAVGSAGAAQGYGMYPYNAVAAATAQAAANGQAGAHTGQVQGYSAGGGGAAAVRLPQTDGPPAEGGGSAAAADDEELLSDDDGDDDDEEETDNFIICQCDKKKIRRTRNKYKVLTRDGIMNLNGTEYMFNKLEGEFVWD
jgi:hypothetical protein